MLRIGPDMSGAAANVGERRFAERVCSAAFWRRSTGSDPWSDGCLPDACLCSTAALLETVCAGNPDARCLCPLLDYCAPGGLVEPWAGCSPKTRAGRKAAMTTKFMRVIVNLRATRPADF